MVFQRLWRGNRFGTFRGGLFLPEEKQRTRDRAIEPLPAPAVLRVPLVPHDGPAAEACVEPGQAVSRGERIGRGDNASKVSVHSPVDGVVRSITTCDTPEAFDVPCVEIDVRGPGEAPPASAAGPNSLDDLVARVAHAGIAAQGSSIMGGGITIASRLHEAATRRCEHLIINAMESDPCLTTESRLLVERGDAVAAGAVRLARLLGVRHVWLAVDRAKRLLVADLTAKAAGGPLRVTSLVNKYPQGDPALLVQVLLRREIPYRGVDLDVGALVVDVGTLVAIELAVRSGEPLTHRLATVSGDAVERPGNYRIPLGMSFRDVLAHVKPMPTLARVIAGSPLTGVAVPHLDVVVTKRTTAILLLSRASLRDLRTAASPEACTRCGWCVDDCPVGLDPSAIHAAAERWFLARAERLNADVCIGCGLCSYVCPSSLPLAESIRAVQRSPRTAAVREASHK